MVSIIIIVTIFLIPHILNTLLFPAYAQSKFYSIHVTSHKDISSAVKEVSRFRKLGYDAFYRYESVKGKGKWYRIYIGNFDDKQEARKIGSELKGKGIISYFMPKKIDQRFREKSPESIDEEKTAPLVKATEKVIEKKPELPQIEIDLSKKDRTVKTEAENQEIQKNTFRTIEEEKEFAQRVLSESKRFSQEHIKIKISERTVIPVKLIQHLKGGQVIVGQSVDFEVARDIIIDEFIVIKRGAPAYGNITSSEKAGYVSSGGKIGLNIDYCKAIDGSRVYLKAILQKEEESHLGANIAASVLLCPFILAAKGEEAELPIGTEFKAYVENDALVKVLASEKLTGKEIEQIQREELEERKRIEKERIEKERREKEQEEREKEQGE